MINRHLPNSSKEALMLGKHFTLISLFKVLNKSTVDSLKHETVTVKCQLLYRINALLNSKLETSQTCAYDVDLGGKKQ